MGKYATAKRKVIIDTFEAASGDMRDKVEPIFISLRSNGNDVLTGDLTTTGELMRVEYKLVGNTLDDDDVLKVFHIAYLDRLTSSFWQAEMIEKKGMFVKLELELTNADTGVTKRMPYPEE